MKLVSKDLGQQGFKRQFIEADSQPGEDQLYYRMKLVSKDLGQQGFKQQFIEADSQPGENSTFFTE